MGPGAPASRARRPHRPPRGRRRRCRRRRPGCAPARARRPGSCPSRVVERRFLDRQLLRARRGQHAADDGQRLCEAAGRRAAARGRRWRRGSARGSRPARAGRAQGRGASRRVELRVRHGRQHAADGGDPGRAREGGQIGRVRREVVAPARGRRLRLRHDPRLRQRPHDRPRAVANVEPPPRRRAARRRRSTTPRETPRSSARPRVAGSRAPASRRPSRIAARSPSASCWRRGRPGRASATGNGEVDSSIDIEVDLPHASTSIVRCARPRPGAFPHGRHRLARRELSRAARRRRPGSCRR